MDRQCRGSQWSRQTSLDQYHGQVRRFCGAVCARVSALCHIIALGKHGRHFLHQAHEIIEGIEVVAEGIHVAELGESLPGMHSLTHKLQHGFNHLLSRLTGHKAKLFGETELLERLYKRFTNMPDFADKVAVLGELLSVQYAPQFKVLTAKGVERYAHFAAKHVAAYLMYIDDNYLPTSFEAFIHTLWGWVNYGKSEKGPRLPLMASYQKSPLAKLSASEWLAHAPLQHAVIQQTSKQSLSLTWHVEGWEKVDRTSESDNKQRKTKTHPTEKQSYLTNPHVPARHATQLEVERLQVQWTFYAEHKEVFPFPWKKVTESNTASNAVVDYHCRIQRNSLNTLQIYTVAEWQLPEAAKQQIQHVHRLVQQRKIHHVLADFETQMARMLTKLGMTQGDFARLSELTAKQQTALTRLNQQLTTQKITQQVYQRNQRQLQVRFNQALQQFSHTLQNQTEQRLQTHCQQLQTELDRLRLDFNQLQDNYQQLEFDYNETQNQLDALNQTLTETIADQRNDLLKKLKSLKHKVTKLEKRPTHIIDTKKPSGGGGYTKVIKKKLNESQTELTPSSQSLSSNKPNTITLSEAELEQHIQQAVAKQLQQLLQGQGKNQNASTRH
jgi:hypothetical protein